MKARSQASDMLADMLAEIMLESNAPEEIKLGLVEVGLKQFMETTKAPNANNAPNENLM